MGGLRFGIFSLLAVAVLIACDGGGDAAKPVADPGAVYLTNNNSQTLRAAMLARRIKRFPVQPGHLNRADCEADGFRWGEVYYSPAGMRAPSQPNASYTSDGEVCWRLDVVFADGGNVCARQSDCEGNCVTERSLRPEKPRCQLWRLPPNCQYLVDNGDYLLTECAVILGQEVIE